LKSARLQKSESIPAAFAFPGFSSDGDSTPIRGLAFLLFFAAGAPRPPWMFVPCRGDSARACIWSVRQGGRIGSALTAGATWCTVTGGFHIFHGCQLRSAFPLFPNAL
jgi:hypothetical protein